MREVELALRMPDPVLTVDERYLWIAKPVLFV